MSWRSRTESGYREEGAPAAESLDTHPPFEAEHLLAPGYVVIEHLHRSNDYDVYDVHSEERACSCIAKIPRRDRLTEWKVRRALVREGDCSAAWSTRT